MRLILLLSFAVLLCADSTPAQTTKPAPPATKPATPTTKPAPATTKPAPRAAAPVARSGIAMILVDATAATIPDVMVEMTGPAPRNGVSSASGQLNFPGLPPGTYRLRFTGDAITAFEREVTLRAGQIEKLTITLNPAPPPPVAPAPAPAPPPVVEPPPPAVGPAGEPQVLSVANLAERDPITSKQPRKDTLVACSGNTRSMLVQLNEPQATRVYEDAEAMYYVIGGEGAINVGGRTLALSPGGYAALPRGASHSITRKGRYALILLAILSGAPCEQAK